LGWPVRFLTRVGDDDYGRMILNLLKKQGFNMNDVQLDTRHPTGTVQVSLDDQGVPRFDIRTQVAYDYFDFNTLEPVAWPDIRMIYIGSLAQRTGYNYTNIQKLMSKKEPRTDVFFDINLRAPHINTTAIEQSLECTGILKLNEEELHLIQSHFDGPETENPLIAWIMERFDIQMVILTKSSQGSTIYIHGKVVESPAPENISITDTVGAGDAYAAVAAAGYLKGLSAETIIEKASNFAAYICTLPGAIPEDMAVYQSMLKVVRRSIHAG